METYNNCEDNEFVEFCESETELIIEDNTIYEVDCECLRRKKTQGNR